MTSGSVRTLEPAAPPSAQRDGSAFRGTPVIDGWAPGTLWYTVLRARTTIMGRPGPVNGARPRPSRSRRDKIMVKAGAPQSNPASLAFPIASTRLRAPSLCSAACR
jgi:hypothetical protein